MTRFEPQISGDDGDHSTNCATTTAQTTRGLYSMQFSSQMNSTVVFYYLRVFLRLSTWFQQETRNPKN